MGSLVDGLAPNGSQVIVGAGADSRVLGNPEVMSSPSG